MAEYAVMPKSDYQDACAAIREKTGKEDLILSGDMGAEIRGISVGVPINNQDKTITENGEYIADEGYTGLGKVTVNMARDDQMDIEAQWKAAIEKRGTQITKLPDGLTRIGTHTFYLCSNLALTSLPDGITTIGEYACYGCTNLALTSLPDGITTFDMYALYGCTKLALTSLPASVANIGHSAFGSCTNLIEITFEGKPNSIYSNAFFGCSNLLVINVPWAEGEFSNAPWGATNATINYNYTGG